MPSGVIDGDAQIVPLRVPIIVWAGLRIIKLVAEDEVLEHVHLYDVVYIQQDAQGLQDVNEGWGMLHDGGAVARM